LAHDRGRAVFAAFPLGSDLPIHASIKRGVPKALLGSRANTHNALDDAQGQADLLAHLMRWTPTPAPTSAGP